MDGRVRLLQCSIRLPEQSNAACPEDSVFASILNNTDRRYFDSDSHTLAKQPLGPQAVYTSLVIFPPFWLGAAPYEGVELSAKTKSSRKGFALSLNKTLLGPVEHFVVLEAMRIEHPAEEPS